MKKSVLLVFSLLVCKFLFAQNVFPTSGNVGIGTTSPSKKLDIVGNGINLENTNHANQGGIIFKNGSRFISNFNYGNNGTITTTGHNIFIGLNAGNFSMGSTATSPFQSSYNIGIGYKVLYNNTTGYHNTAIGYQALYQNTTGYNNTALGYVALKSNTSGIYNTAIGYEALYLNTTGNRNTAIGYAALFQNTTGCYNTTIGFQSLFHNTTGYYNTAIGYYSLFYNTTGSYNTSSGYGALKENNTGKYNTANGYAALYNNSDGDYNTATGFQAGRYIAGSSTGNTGGSTSVFLGAFTRSSTSTDNNEVVIGYQAIGAGSNSVVLGNTSITKTLLRGNVGIGTTTPQSKLAVNGTITAQKVKVTQSGWPDYVFDSAYQLPSLLELSDYIKINHHLPGFPSSKEIENEGLDIGKMQKMQAQKIEELTLYQINSDEKIRQLKDELKTYKDQLSELKEEIKQLKNNSK